MSEENVELVRRHIDARGTRSATRWALSPEARHRPARSSTGWPNRTTVFASLDVWEDRATFDKFAEEQIGPFSAEVGAPQPEITEYAVHNTLAQ